MSWHDLKGDFTVEDVVRHIESALDFAYAHGWFKEVWSDGEARSIVVGIGDERYRVTVTPYCDTTKKEGA